MFDAYKRANLALHPPLALREATVAGMDARRRPKARRRWPAYVSAAAAVLAVVLLVSLMPRPGRNNKGQTRALRAYALSEPRYPDYPTRINNMGVEREGFFQEFQRYWSQLPNEVDEDFARQAAGFSKVSSRLVLAGATENRIYSPVDLWMALAMLAETAGGTSRQQILDALGVDSLETLRQQTRAMWLRSYVDDGTVATVPAGSIWLNKGLSYNKDTLDSLAEYYFAGSYAVEMGTEKANKAIAQWLDAQTGGLLQDSTGNIQTSPLDVMRLYATLYYYGRWSQPFHPGNNTQDTFTRADGQEVTAEFMHTKRDSNVLFGETFTAAPLHTKNTSVYFVLPDEGRSVDEVLQDDGLWAGLAHEEDAEGIQWGFYKTEWSLPKFDIASDVDLDETIRALGITDVFSEAADFSALTAGTDLPIELSGAHQAARIQVDEEGIRGVAYTELPAAGAPPPPDDIVIMDLDRPFLLVVTSPVEGVPLFVGVVNDPTATLS